MTGPSVSATAPVRGGSYEEGLTNGRKLLDSHPLVALQQARTLLRNRPDARAHRLAAAALRRLDQAPAAEQDELAAIQLGLADPELAGLAAAFADGRAAETRNALEHWLSGQPDDLLARTLAAEAALAFWDLADAESQLRPVIERAPSFLRAAMLMATCLARQARIREAVTLLEAVVERKPDNAAALTYLAQLAAEAGDNARAAEVYERLVELEPDAAEGFVHLAQHRRILGQGDAAVSAFRRALAIDPGHGSAWWGLSNYYPDRIAAEDEVAVRAAIESARESSDSGALHLALANLLDRRGDHSGALEYFRDGKRLRLAKQPYDAAASSAEVEAAIAAFTPALVKAHGGAGADDDAPIFILGMPRSGSTLVMRILGRHLQIEDAGELPIFPRLAEHLRFSLTGGRRYSAMLEALTPATVRGLGEGYLARAADYRRGDAPRFVDKLNLNWLHAGLIRLALPNARIIDVRRGAVDCCWANFKMLFAQGHPAANDLGHIGSFYRDYVRMMDAVDAVAPGGILQVRYEAVVDDIERETRRMLDFLGLDYDPACIDFHLGEAAIATASSEQVRRPLYREGVGSAEPYRPWLEPLIDALGPLAER